MMLTITLGCLIGILMGMTGAGGGILAIPALVYGLHLTMTQAAPTALIAIAVAALLGAWLGLQKGIVRYRAALIMALAGMITSPLGTLVSQQLEHHTLVILYVGVLMYSIYFTLHQSNATEVSAAAPVPCELNQESGRFIWTNQCAISVSLSGALVGFLSGLLGVGGGFIVLPALQAVSTLNKESTVATALAVIATVSLSAAVSHAFMGEIVWLTTLLFTTGALIGIILGSKALPHLALKWVKRIYLGLLLGVVLRMLISVV